MFWVACPRWIHVVSRCFALFVPMLVFVLYMVTFMTFNSWGLRQEARSADMEVPVLTLLSKQLQGELQFARYRKAHFTQSWQGKVAKFRKCSKYGISEWKKAVFKAFWNWWRLNKFDFFKYILYFIILYYIILYYIILYYIILYYIILYIYIYYTFICSNIPKISFSEPHDNVWHPDFFVFPFACGGTLEALFLCCRLNRRLCVNFQW